MDEFWILVQHMIVNIMSNAGRFINLNPHITVQV